MKIIQFCGRCKKNQEHEIQEYPHPSKPGWSTEVQKCMHCNEVREFERSHWPKGYLKV
jgi:hypothetical protein